MMSPERKVILVPFEKTKKMKLILSLKEKMSADYLNFIDQEAQRYGISLSILFINDSSTKIPQFVVRKDATIINKGIDYSGNKLISDACSKFISDDCDICMVAFNTYSVIADNIAEQASASLKIGPDFKYRNPYDVSIKINKKYEGESIVKDFIRQLSGITRNPVSSGELLFTSA